MNPVPPRTGFFIDITDETGYHSRRAGVFPRRGRTALFRRRADRDRPLPDVRGAVRTDAARRIAAGHRRHRKYHRRQSVAESRIVAPQRIADHPRMQTAHLARAGGPPRPTARRAERSQLPPDRPDAVRRLPESPSGDESRRTRRHGGQRPRNRRTTAPRRSPNAVSRDTPPSAAGWRPNATD